MTKRKNTNFIARNTHNRSEQIVLMISIVELTIFTIGFVWGTFNTNNLASVLTAFIWLANVPLVILSCILSIFAIRDIDSASTIYRVFFSLNWLVLVAMIINVID